MHTAGQPSDHTAEEPDLTVRERRNRPSKQGCARARFSSHLDELAASRIAYVPFFPLGGFSPLQSSALNDVAVQLGATAAQVALAWLLQRAPNVLLIPGTSSLAHLQENLASATLPLSAEMVAPLNRIADNR